MVYNGKSYEHGWSGGTPILGNTTQILRGVTAPHPRSAHVSLALSILAFHPGQHDGLPALSTHTFFRSAKRCGESESLVFFCGLMMFDSSDSLNLSLLTKKSRNCWGTLVALFPFFERALKAPGDSSEFEKKKKLTCDFDAQSGSYRVTWYVDARKLDTWLVVSVLSFFPQTT